MLLELPATSPYSVPISCNLLNSDLDAYRVLISKFHLHFLSFQMADITFYWFGVSRGLRPGTVRYDVILKCETGNQY